VLRRITPPARCRAGSFIVEPMPTLNPRQIHGPDRVLTALDGALRALLAPARAKRTLPEVADGPLTDAERRESAALMRVNHAGEIAAQALYQGQALVARNPRLREELLAAGREETEHLAWTESRLDELGSRTSLLDPLWYAGSFAIGMLAGLSGDRTSLGFVEETERQVERHLDGHLDRLPPNDARSRVIIEQMREDEIAHGRRARDLGAQVLPIPVRRVMQATARIMTRSAYWI
jgi:ubiquinone biosynthesis monooxygenase Coq7